MQNESQVSRTSRGGSYFPFSPSQRWISYLLILGSVILISGAFIPREWFLLVLALSGALTYGALWIRDVSALSTTLLCTLITFFLWLPRLSMMWPLPLVLALGCYGLLVRLSPRLRSSVHWFRWGKMNRKILLMVLGSIVLSSFALLAWYKLSHPNVSDLRTRIPSVPLWVLPLVGLGFAVINAAAEEVVYRGVVYAGLESLFGPGWVVIFIQAIVFGCAHFHGFPRGPMGVLLAAFYGGMMGMIRYSSQGLFAPWLAHVCTDFTIFLILAYCAA